MVSVKIKKQLNLPQLIEWAWEYGLKEITFYSINDDRGVAYEVSFAEDGSFYSPDEIKPEIIFTVEFEEEIDEYTVFQTLVKVIEDGTVYTCTDATINREKNSAVVEIHAILNGVLKLIWTHDKGLVE